MHPDQNLGVVDVSFISLIKVLPALWELLLPPRELIALVKPQFEVGRDRLGKKWCSARCQARQEAVAQVIAAAEALGWQCHGVTPSPILGPAGNQEFLAYFSCGSVENASPQNKMVSSS